jgi:Ribonuclease G/E
MRKVGWAARNGSKAWETPSVPNRETERCPGCHRDVAVARPEGIAVEIVRDLTADGREEITITIGRVVVHHCMLFADGEWR